MAPQGRRHRLSPSEHFSAAPDLSALHEAVDTRLRAFALDNHPAHVVVAYQAIRAARMRPDETVLAALDQILPRARFSWRVGGHRRAQGSLRDMRMLDQLEAVTGSRVLPAVLPAGFAARTAARLGIRPTAAKMALSRLRRRLAAKNARP